MIIFEKSTKLFTVAFVSLLLKSFNFFGIRLGDNLSLFFFFCRLFSWSSKFSLYKVALFAQQSEQKAFRFETCVSVFFLEHNEFFFKPNIKITVFIHVQGTLQILNLKINLVILMQIINFKQKYKNMFQVWVEYMYEWDLFHRTRQTRH